MPSNPFSKGPQGYKPGHLPQSEQAAWQAVSQRAGAQRTPDGGFDYTGVGTPMRGPAAVQQAKRGYSFSPIQQAIGGTGQKRRLDRVNFQGLPQSFGRQAYERGAKDIRREGAGQLQQLQEAVGVRRPGLLTKAAQDSQRQIGENLADLRSGIALDVMGRDVDLGVQEQLANIEQQRAEEAMDLDRLGQLYQMGAGQIGLESDLLARERDYADRALEFLMNLYGQAAQSANQAENVRSSSRGQTLGFLGSLFGG